MTPSFDYQLVTKLGESAASAAWLGRNLDSGANALVRVFHGTLWRRPDARGQFVDRAEALQAIHHPHLARQLEAGCLPDGRPFVVSEYLEGEDLATHLRRSGPLTADQLALLIPALCSALTELRARGILVHTLPCEQVFLVGGLSRYAPKLVGPGLADGPGPSEDARADVAAGGRLMREALGGGSGGWLEPVLQRCLQPIPTERFADPSALARALDAAQPRTQELRQRNTGTTPLLLVEEAVREREGDVIGQYRLERLLGEGSMGRVFLARHITLGRPAAIKVLRAEHAQNQNLIQRFFHEARAVNQINHEHIVEIQDFVHEPGPSGRTRVYCVMEMLDGQSLTQVLAHERLSVTRAVDVGVQVAQALGAAHQVGVVHRDVKPDNLFLVLRGTERDFVKVLDFGVAKLMTPIGDLPLTSTVEGTIVGTPAYMAPEQANGLGADARTDQYALGCVLYEALAGHPPFSGSSFGQLVAKVLTEPAPPLPSRTAAGERIPASLRAVVLRCLAKDPVDRFRDMPALEAALMASLLPAPRRPRAGGKLALRLASSLLLVLAVTTAFRYRQAARARAELASATLPAPPPPVMELTPPPPPAAPEPVPPAPPPEPAMVALRIRSQPRGARVERLDSGEVLGTTPLNTRVPETAGNLVLRLSAPGHAPVVRSLPAQGSVQLEVRLPVRKPAAAEAKPAPVAPARAHHPDPFKL
jgi:serine/threonine protein kinase